MTVLLSGACTTPPTKPMVVAINTAVPSVPEEPAPPPPPPSASVVPAVERREPLPARSTTPGTIQCEILDCDLATEVCCYDESQGRGRCVANHGPSPRCAPHEQERACDESSDCMGGARCCRVSQADASCARQERWLCNPHGCGQTGDPTDELCLPGSGCVHGPCREWTLRTGLQGLCPPDTPPLACGARRCAAGEICCWTAKHRRGSCVKSVEQCPLDYSTGLTRKLFFCRSPADCPTEECFSATGDGFDESYRCAETRCNPMEYFLGPRLCRRDADCPLEIELSASEMLKQTYHFTDCSADKDYPPGVKVCHYRPGVVRSDRP